MKSPIHSFATIPQQRGLALRKRLFEKYGVRLENAFRGSLANDASDVSVELEPADDLYLSASVESSPPVNALQANADLPGTLRFAVDRQGWHLVADTRLNGEAHLPNTLQELLRAIARVRNGQTKHRRKPSKMAAAAPERLEQVLKSASLADNPPVNVDGESEMRCRLGGHIVATRISRSGSGIRIRRGVVSSLQLDKPRLEAVADVALRLNLQIRHARLAFVNNEIRVEARLSACLIEPAWVNFYMRAVAAASLHVTPTLRLLASQPQVAQWWSAVANFESQREERPVGSC